MTEVDQENDEQGGESDEGDTGVEGIGQFCPEQILESVLNHYQDVFSDSPGETHMVKHSITVKDGLAAVSVPMDIEGTKVNLVSGTVEGLISQGILESCHTAIFNTISICQGEQDLNPNVELDFTQLNKFTGSDTIPTLNVDTLVEIVANAEFISVVGIKGGLYQILIKEEH